MKCPRRTPSFHITRTASRLIPRTILSRRGGRFSASSLSSFSRLFTNQFKDEECSFRHRRTAPEHLKRRARAFGTLIGVVIDYLETKLELPAYNVPSGVYDGTRDGIEGAAQTCRLHWGLGLDTPITHIGRVLENAGIPIVKTLASTATIDAFSRRGRTPIVIVNTFKESPSHWIFDMAHELGPLRVSR